MAMDELTEKRIAQIKKEIASLPKGCISRKIIHGKAYYYHQWYFRGKIKSKYLSWEEATKLSDQIEWRKFLQKGLGSIKENGYVPKDWIGGRNSFSW